METSDHYMQSRAEILPKTLIDAFEKNGYIRNCEKNSVIYSQGENADYFYYLKSGRVRIFITSKSGSEKTLSTVSEGAILGEAAFFDSQPRISSAKALTKCEIIAIDKLTLASIIQKNPQTAMELFKLQAQTIRLLSAQVDSIAFLTAKRRIAGFLLDNTDVSKNKVSVNITHEEIGNIIGTSRVTVSKIITKLAKDGAIQTGYRCITVKNFSALQELSELEDF